MNKFSDVHFWAERYSEAMRSLQATGVAEDPDKFVLDYVGWFESMPGRVIFEAGCGPGRHIPVLLPALPQGGIVYAIDGVASVVADINRKYIGRPVRACQADLNKPLEGLENVHEIGGFLCTDVLSVVDSPLALLANLHAICMSGAIGMLTFQTTGDETFGDGDRLPEDIPGTVVESTTDGTRFRFFEIEQTRSLLEQCGFKIEVWEVFQRLEEAHHGRPYQHTHEEVGCVIRVAK